MHSHTLKHAHTDQYIYISLFHSKSGFVNTPQCYVIRTLPVLMELNSVAQSESCQQTNSLFVVTVLPKLPKVLYYTAAKTEELMAETGLFYAQNSFHYTAQTKSARTLT